MFMITRIWWRRRWKVWQMGHTIGEETWLATFRHEAHARGFMARMSDPMRAMEDFDVRKS